MATAQRSTTTYIVDVGSIIVNSSTVSSRFGVGPFMALTSACLINIFYNTNAISTTTENGDSFYYTLNYWEINATVNRNLMNYPLWGPRFDFKCLIGIYSI